MTGIRILDRSAKGALAFDLKDILEALGTDALCSTWQARDVECTGPAAEGLHEASDAGAAIDGIRLLAIAKSLWQVIDGEFTARVPGATRDWIVIRAVDSSFFEVLTDRSDALDNLRRRFETVEVFADKA